MRTNPYFVSLHHRIRLDENLPPLGPLDADSARLIAGAAGVLMPKYCTPSRYRLVASIARSYFPNPRPKIAYRGKAKQIRLFRSLSIHHPRTLIYPTPSEAKETFDSNPRERPSLPFVLKGDSGGGGSAVFPIHTSEEFFEKLSLLPREEPVLLQEWIENGGKDLRVVLMGSEVKSYFRVGGDSFYNNVSKGARIDFELMPEKQQEGVDLALAVAQKTGIDFAAFDVMFPANGGSPFIVEINFLFGRKGLGGLKGYEEMYLKAVEGWMGGLLSKMNQSALLTERTRPSLPVTSTSPPASTGSAGSLNLACQSSPRTRT